MRKEERVLKLNELEGLLLGIDKRLEAIEEERLDAPEDPTSVLVDKLSEKEGLIRGLKRENDNLRNFIKAEQTKGALEDYKFRTTIKDLRDRNQALNCVVKERDRLRESLNNQQERSAALGYELRQKEIMLQAIRTPREETDVLFPVSEYVIPSTTVSEWIAIVFFMIVFVMAGWKIIDLIIVLLA